MQSARAVLHCHLWPVWSQHIFPHYFINDTIFVGGKKKSLLNIKCVFWFSLQLLSETSLILRKIHRDTSMYVHKSSWKVPVILFRCQWNLNFLSSFSKKKKNPNTKFHENPPSGIRVVSCGQRNRQTDMTKLTVAFRNSANASTNCSQYLRT